MENHFSVTMNDVRKSYMSNFTLTARRGLLHGLLMRVDVRVSWIYFIYKRTGRREMSPPRHDSGALLIDVEQCPVLSQTNVDRIDRRCEAESPCEYSDRE